MRTPRRRARPRPKPNSKLADYEIAIGPNTGYYLPQFEEFDAGGSKRRLALAGVLRDDALVLLPQDVAARHAQPGLSWRMIVIVVAGSRRHRRGRAAGAAAHDRGIVIGLLLVAPWILLPMYANALYWRHIRKLIERRRAPSRSSPRSARRGSSATAAPARAP